MITLPTIYKKKSNWFIVHKIFTFDRIKKLFKIFVMLGLLPITNGYVDQVTKRFSNFGSVINC